MRKAALLIGIDEYPSIGESATLNGCVNDANNVARLLSSNSNGTPNFFCKKLLSYTGETTIYGTERKEHSITKILLKEYVVKLFANADGVDAALFYFSGHGHSSASGTHLVTMDAEKYDEGLPFSDLVTIANSSAIPNIFIVLDCCYSGAAGSLPGLNDDVSFLRKGITIMSASAAGQVAAGLNGAGIFTTLFCTALGGAAADYMGNVTAAGVYSFISNALGPWDQRPTFKANIVDTYSLRQTADDSKWQLMLKIPKYFKFPKHYLQLTPDYEPEAKPPNPEKEAIFNDLQKLRDLGLVTAHGEEHLYYAAVNSRYCKLTAVGQALYQKLSLYHD